MCPLDRQKQGRQRGYPRVSSDTPSFAAFNPCRTWCSIQRLSDTLNADFLLCLWIDSNASFPRLKAASTRFGSAVQTKGFGVELVSARNRLIATWRSTRERKTPRLRRRLVGLAKKPPRGGAMTPRLGPLRLKSLDATRNWDCRYP